MVVAYAVFEGVFDEDDQQQRRDRQLFGQVAGRLHADIHGVGVTNAHQFDVVFQELDVAVKRNDLAPRLVEHVTHHLRKLDHGVLGRLGVDVDQRVDVVERVHKEVRVDLVFQVIHFGLKVLALERLHLLFVAHRLVYQLDTRVGSGHKESQHHVPVHLQIGERRFAVGVERFGIVLFEEVVREVVLVDLHQPEDADDQRQVAREVFPVFSPEHVARGDDGIVDEKDDQIGGDIPPGSQHVFQVDMHFGHHLRVEDRDQDDGRPDHHVEQVFTDGLFFLDFHASNIVKVAGKAKLV